MGIIDLSEGPEAPKFVEELIFDTYRFHSYSDGSYKIYKDVDEEPCYEIHSAAGCNCPSATYRNAPCKHEKMVNFNRAEVDAAPSPTQEVENAQDLADLLGD